MSDHCNAEVEIELLRKTVAEVHEARIAAAVEGSEWKARALRVEEKAERLLEAWTILSSYAVTARRHATREWMFGLEDAINRAAEKAEDPDRAVCDSDGMALWLKKARVPGGSFRR